MASANLKSQHKRWLITFVAVLGIAGGVTWVVQTSSTALVSKVEVQVAERSMIRNISNVAAIEVGDRITELNLDAAAARVTQLPQVRSAEVTRRWPDRIVIAVELRRPIGWLQEADKIRYIDDNGEKYDPAAAFPKPGLAQFEVGEDRLLAASAIAYQHLPALQKLKLTKISAQTSSNIRFTLSNGVTIIWGSVDRSPRKAEVLSVLLQRKAKVYDVSAPDLPTIRLQ
jgi:cell division protein FtsQ